jgi:hypothetical protein
VATPTSPPSASRTTTTLSPAAAPFFPSGHSKGQRWEDSSPSTAGSEEPPSPLPRPSYRDVLASRPVLVQRVPPPPPRVKNLFPPCACVRHWLLLFLPIKDWSRRPRAMGGIRALPHRQRLLQSRDPRRRCPKDPGASASISCLLTIMLLLVVALPAASVVLSPGIVLTPVCVSS